MIIIRPVRSSLAVAGGFNIWVKNYDDVILSKPAPIKSFKKSH